MRAIKFFTVLILAVAVAGVSGCVSQGKYDELQMQNQSQQQRINAVAF